jgi:hypothetical protein
MVVAGEGVTLAGVAVGAGVVEVALGAVAWVVVAAWAVVVVLGHRRAE